MELGPTNKKIYSDLESRTKIDADTWRQWHRKQSISEPSARLIQAASLTWPQYSFWLVTGFDDPLVGQKSRGKGTRHTQLLNGINDEETSKKLDEIAEITGYYYQIHVQYIRRLYGEATEEEQGLGKMINLDEIDQKKMDVLLLSRLRKIKDVINEQIKKIENDTKN